MDQPVFVIRCHPHPDAIPRPPHARQAHLDHLRAHARVLRFAGPGVADNGTSTGAYAVIEGSREDAERFIASEPFYVAGAFGGVTIQRFVPQVGSRQVDITPGPDTAMFFCRWDTADGVAAPWDADDRHLRVLEHGPLTDDEGSRTTGHLLLVEVRSASGAHRERLGLLTADPEAMTADRWRFGNALSGVPDARGGGSVVGPSR